MIDLRLFVLDFIKRVMSTTPKFFKVLQFVGVVLAVVTGLPLLLTSAGIELPNNIMTITNKVVAISSLIASFIAQLTVVPEEQKQLNFK